ncbi:MAG: hypothetical protein ACI9EW_003024, partial [Cellvibrionaceae bacterium]
MLNQVNQVRVILVGVLAVLLLTLFGVAVFVRPQTIDADEVELTTTELESGERIDSSPAEIESDLPVIPTRSIVGV